jgi:DNA-directed RNA polymerase beta' subunit
VPKAKQTHHLSGLSRGRNHCTAWHPETIEARGLVLQDCRCLLWGRVLAKEYEDDWLEIPEDTKEIARQDLLLECRLKSKHCTSSASNWLAYLGFKYGPFFRSYYTDGHERPEQKKHRVQYAKYLCDKEIRKYKWVQLNQDQKEELVEGLEEDPLE